MPTEDLMPLEDDDLVLNRPRSGGRTPILAGLAFFFALGAISLTALLWWGGRDGGGTAGPEVLDSLERLQQGQSGQARQISALESRLDAAPEQSGTVDTTAIESAVAELQAGTATLRRELEAQQSYGRTLQQALETMQARMVTVEAGLAARSPAAVNAPGQFDLAGVEYLLRLAPERLTLFQDVRSADEALALADAQLAGQDNPVYLGLRREIADARQALGDVSLPNPADISARIDSVQAGIVNLDFRSGGESDPGSAAGGEVEQGWWARLKSSLASLVTVRRNSGDADARLSIEDKDMLRQGLWMQLEAARLAMMRHDQAAWDDTLARADAALSRWFDDASGGVQSSREGLAALADTTISPDLPDISGPWEQLQLIRKARAAPMPPPPPPRDVPAENAEPEEDVATRGEDTEEPVGADETE